MIRSEFVNGTRPDPFRVGSTSGTHGLPDGDRGLDVLDLGLLTGNLPILGAGARDGRVNRRLMTLERIDPEGLNKPATYTHVVIASGSRLVFVAGQVAEDDNGDLVGRDDLRIQAQQAFSNLGRALAGAGAGPEQVARLGIFVVALKEDHLPAIEAARVALFKDHKPVDTLLGVQMLAHAGCLIEIEAIAVISG